MTVPEQPTQTEGSKLVRAAIWVAIGALIAAAIVCVVWVLVGTQNGIVGRAFLTIVLLAAFAGVAILDAHLAPGRPAWLALASMATWVLALLVGAFLIWMPERDFSYFGRSGARSISFILIVLILQAALLHLRLFVKAFQRRVTTFTTIVTYVTIALVVILATMLIIPLVLNEWVEFHDLYWRFVVAATILAAVGTALVPLVNALFAPRRPRSAAAAYGQPYGGAYGATQSYGAAQTYGGVAYPSAESVTPQAWPTYVDGTTPLPVLPDGAPDWNAYYTGYPSPGAQVLTVTEPFAASAPAQSHEPSAAASSDVPAVPPVNGYEGYPPPPPLPPRP